MTPCTQGEALLRTVTRAAEWYPPTSHPNPIPDTHGRLSGTGALRRRRAGQPQHDDCSAEFDSPAAPYTLPIGRFLNAMPQATPTPDPKDRAGIELRCLARALIPMPEDNGRKVAKAVALILVCVWSLITLSLTFEGVAAVSPPFYGVFTAVIFALVGKLWDIEVQEYLSRQ